MPCGCDPSGIEIVRVTVWLEGLMTLIVGPRLFVTQTSPVDAMAMDRGALPTVICLIRDPVDVLRTLTEFLSWLTTHRRSAPVGRSSKTRLPEIEGRFGSQRDSEPSARWSSTASCRTTSRTVTVT